MLLILDGIVNLGLGIILLLFPLGADKYLGLPVPENYFYSSILGGVIFGIGLALILERFGHALNFRGLGLGGAILINMAGSLVLIFWLMFIELQIPLHGYIILWIIGISVLLIGILEILGKSWKY